MNLLISKKLSATACRLALALLALIVVVHPAKAQEEPGRWLLIFDTATAMKKRLPGVEASVTNLLAKGAGGQLARGDSIALWTFDKQLHGDFPPITWIPEYSRAISSNTVAFLRSQKYSGETRMSLFQPSLDRVIARSERLTVIIYCDGADAISGTPYDEVLNKIFQQEQSGRAKARQPFAVVLRTQQGKYVGGTVNFPPEALSIPPFPPLPVIAVAQVKTVPVKPVSTVPPLVVTGMKTATNPPVAPKPAVTNVVPPAPPANVPATVPPPVPVLATVTNVVIQTNVVVVFSNTAAPVVQPVSAPTNAVAPRTNAVSAVNAALPAPTNVVAAIAKTNASPPAPVVGTRASKNLQAISLAAGAVVILGIAAVTAIRSRRPRGSLISDSMQPRDK